MLTVRVRPAQAHDAATLARFSGSLARASEGRDVDTATVLAAVTAAVDDLDKARYFVACHGEEVVGSLFVTSEWSDWTNGWYWWIQGVWVEPAWRRLGVWRSLLQAVDDEAARRGVRRLRLYVHEANAAARSGYDATGFHAEPYRIYDREVAARGTGDA